MPARSSSSLGRPPAAEAFPAHPASWYLFCAGRELRRGPLSRTILGRRLVAFRTAGGRAAVMDAHCAHLGADLGCGSVVGETIQCPFHHWRYGTDGACAAIPNRAEVPAFARLRTYPVAERHGYLFFFNGREPLFPLPFVLGADPREYAAAGKAFSYVADCTWYMNSAHAFDLQHFAAVHDRELLAPPEIDRPAPFARRNRYRAKVVGDSAFDRLLRAGAGRTVSASLTIWGGTFAVVTADFGHLRSAFLLVMEPLDDGGTLCQGIVLARRGRLGFLDRPRLGLRRRFTHSYLKEEARRLRATRYNPGGLGPDDQEMVDFFHWAASLPQAAPAAGPTKASAGDDENANRSDSSDAVVPEPGAGVRAAAAAGGRGGP